MLGVLLSVTWNGLFVKYGIATILVIWGILSETTLLVLVGMCLENKEWFKEFKKEFKRVFCNFY